MAEVTTYRCDECGKLKQDANHWFRAWVRSTPAVFVIAGWNTDSFAGLHQPDIDALETELHLCGMECATRAMQKALSAGAAKPSGV